MKKKRRKPKKDEKTKDFGRNEDGGERFTEKNRKEKNIHRIKEISCRVIINPFTFYLQERAQILL